MRLAALLLAVVIALPLSAAELDQHGREQPWKGKPGSYTLVDFAASWCKPCWRSLPHLESLARQYPSLQVVVVSVDEKVAGRDRLVEGMHLTLPVVWDETTRIASHYSPEGMPATFVLDRDGKVIYSSIGFNDRSWKSLREFVAKLPLN